MFSILPVFIVAPFKSTQEEPDTRKSLSLLIQLRFDEIFLRLNVTMTISIYRKVSIFLIQIKINLHPW